MNSLPILILLFLVGAVFAWLLRRGRYSRQRDHANKPPQQPCDLQAALDLSPTLIWAERNGQVVWENKPSASLFEKTKPKGIGAFIPISIPLPSDQPSRIKLKADDTAKTNEYCLEKSSVAETDYYYLSNAKPLIDAEQELQRFIQTLTETFAHLPIGLAIFDKKRNLSLFNPALSRLLDIPAEWLIRRPSLMSFLDRLRSEGIMPEPDDFLSVRQDFRNLENGSVNGTFQAEWTLANGKIFRVVGRPHVKGGMALLFEDISGAVMVERQYRAELEKLYSVLDCLGDGIAIFDPAGELVFVNDAFDEIWDTDLVNALVPITVIEFTRQLQDLCKPSPVWGDFREYVLNSAERSQWQSEIIMKSGKQFSLTFSPIAGGQVFCEFRYLPS